MATETMGTAGDGDGNEVHGLTRHRRRWTGKRDGLVCRAAIWQGIVVQCTIVTVPEKKMPPSSDRAPVRATDNGLLFRSEYFFTVGLVLYGLDVLDHHPLSLLIVVVIQ